MRRRTILALCGTATLPLAGCIGPTDHSPGGDGPGVGTPAQELLEEAPAEPSLPDGSEWPHYGFDVRNRGYNSTAHGPRNEPALAWRYDAGTPTMNSSPVIVDGVIYGTGTGEPGGLFALDAVTGEELWHAETDGYVTGAPAVGEDAVYVGTWGQTIQAVDRKTGDVRWRLDIEHRIGNAAPTLANGTLYVATHGYGPLVGGGEENCEAPAVIALEPDTGDERWRYDAFDAKDHIETTPAVANGRVVFTNEGIVYALDAATGTKRWQQQTESHTELSPTIVADRVIVGGRSADGAAVIALDLQNGAERWRTAIDANNFGVSPAVADGVVYAAATQLKPCPDHDDDCEPEIWGKLYALGLADGAVRWSTALRPDTRSAPAVAGDTVYVGDGDGVTAVARDGERLWQRTFAADDEDAMYVKSSPAVAGDLLVIGASDGGLRAIVETDR